MSSSVSSVDVPKPPMAHERSLPSARSAWSTPLNVTTGSAGAGAGPSQPPPATTMSALAAQPFRRPLMASNANVPVASRNRPQVVAGPHAPQHAPPQIQRQVQTHKPALAHSLSVNQGKPAGLSVVDFTNRDAMRSFPTFSGYLGGENDLRASSGGPASVPLARSSPPSSNDAGLNLLVRGEVGAIGDGRKRSAFTEIPPQVEVEQTAALLRSLNLTPPPPSNGIVVNGPGIESSHGGLAPNMGHPILSLNTNLGMPGQYLAMDPAVSRRSAFNPFVGSWFAGTPVSLSPVTPDQGDVFDPRMGDEYLAHQNPHAVLGTPSFDTFSHFHHQGDSSMSTVHTAHATPTKNGPNPAHPNASTLEHYSIQSNGSINSSGVDHGLPSPPSNSNSDGSTTSTGPSAFSSVPLILSPPTHVGNFQFQVPATPYLRSPSPYWRHLAENQSLPRQSQTSPEPEAVAIEAASSQKGGSNSTVTDGWVSNVSANGESVYQDGGDSTHRPFPSPHGTSSVWVNPATQPTNPLSFAGTAFGGVPYNLHDLASIPSPSHTNFNLPDTSNLLFRNILGISPQTALNPMGSDIGASLLQWSKLAALNGLNIIPDYGSVPPSAPNINSSHAQPPATAMSNGSLTLPPFIPMADNPATLKPNLLAPYTATFVKEAPAQKDAAPWLTNDSKINGDLGYPTHRHVLGEAGSISSAGSTRSSTVSQRFNGSRMEDDENINFLQLLQPNARPPYPVLVYRIVKKSDQQASIFIQQKLKNASSEERARIVGAIVDRGLEMMQGRFGNWCVQRCLEPPCERADRMRIVECMAGHVVELATNCYGTHVVQKALECEEDIKRVIVGELLDNDPAYTLTSKHCSHVWAKVMELSWHDGPAPPIFSVVNHSLRGKWASLACHETGSLVVQTMFENMDDADDKRVIVDEILDNLDGVVKNQWGAFVVQHIIEHGNTDVSHRTSLSLIANMASYGTHDVAVKSILKILKEKDPLMMDAAISKMCEVNSTVHRNKRPIIVDLALSSNGSQIIQAVLPEANKDQRSRLYDAVKGHTVTLRGCKTGSRVIWLFDRMASRFE